MEFTGPFYNSNRSFPPPVVVVVVVVVVIAAAVFVNLHKYIPTWLYIAAVSMHRGVSERLCLLHGVPHPHLQPVPPGPPPLHGRVQPPVQRHAPEQAGPAHLPQLPVRHPGRRHNTGGQERDYQHTGDCLC